MNKVSQILQIKDKGAKRNNEKQNGRRRKAESWGERKKVKEEVEEEREALSQK